jgi:hypothetical protein
MKCNFEHKRNINSEKEELSLELMNKFWKEKGRGGEGLVIIKKSNICPTLVFAMASNLHDQNMTKPQNCTSVGWVFDFVNNLRSQFLKAIDEWTDDFHERTVAA